MRIIVGEIMQESNSFCPILTSLQNFKDYIFLEGNEIPRKLKDTNTEVAGFMDVMDREKSDPLYTLAANAVSSGPVQTEALNFLIQNLLERLEKFGDIDGVYIVLHGGMLVGETGDGSGQILQAVREKVGPNIPIVASLDLHANVTSLMVKNTDALVAYHTFPHVDLRQTGTKTTEILLKIIKGEIMPEMVVCKIPMLLPGEISATDKEPALKIVQALKKIEAQPGIITASFCHVQPWLDTPDVGCSTVVVANKDKELAKKEVRKLADVFWSLRHDFQPSLVPVKEAIQKAMKAEKGPIIFVDSADAPSSGAPGDGTAVLEALLDSKVDQPGYTMVVNPEAVNLAIEAGVGATISVSLGGKIDKVFTHPIKVTARVKTISDGVFKNQGLTQHGVENHMGRTVVLVADKIYIVVMERPVFAWDPGLYRSVGLEPKDARIVVVKCGVTMYEDITKEMVFLDTPGVSSPHLTRLPYEHITRPLYPFDDVKEYECREVS